MSKTNKVKCQKSIRSNVKCQKSIRSNVKCQKSIRSNVKSQKLIRLIFKERTSGVPPVIFFQHLSSPCVCFCRRVFWVISIQLGRAVCLFLIFFQHLSSPCVCFCRRVFWVISIQLGRAGPEALQRQRSWHLEATFLLQPLHHNLAQLGKPPPGFGNSR